MFSRPPICGEPACHARHTYFVLTKQSRYPISGPLSFGREPRRCTLFIPASLASLGFATPQASCCTYTVHVALTHRLTAVYAPVHHA